jgi:serine/threonine protein kinase
MIGDLLLDKDAFVKEQKIGEGGFGTVSLGRLRDGRIVAIKDVNTGSSESVKSMKYLLREVQVMSRMRHPATLGLIGCRLPEPGSGAQIVMEYCRNGSLGDLFDRLYGRCEAIADWTATRQSKCVIGISAGLLFIHSRGFIHRDMKPLNILLDDNFEPRICDFGLARVDGTDMSVAPASPLTAAPDVLMDMGGYINKVDVYSLGVTLYMFFARPAHVDDDKPAPQTPYAFIERITRGARFAYDTAIPPFYWALIQACWRADPNERPSLAQVVKLLASDRQWLFEGTDAAALSIYEGKVLADVGPAIAKARRFNPADVRTAEPARSMENSTTIVDIARLAEKLTSEGEFEIVREIGPLDNGKMYEVTSADDGKRFSMKAFNAPEWRSYMREVESMAMATHPAALSFVGWRPFGQEDPHAIIVTDFYPNGNLLDIIKNTAKGKRPAGWTATKQSIAVAGIACLMHKLHRLGIIHGQLKAENVFLDTNYDVHVGQFGQPPLPPAGAHSWQMYPYAPEVLEQKRAPTDKVDVYSYGILLYSMFREPNFLDDAPTRPLSRRADFASVVLNGRRFIRDVLIPDFYWALITACWRPEPERRPTFAQVVELLSHSTSEYAIAGTNMEDLDAYEQQVFPPPVPDSPEANWVFEFKRRYLASRRYAAPSSFVGGPRPSLPASKGDPLGHTTRRATKPAAAPLFAPKGLFEPGLVEERSPRVVAFEAGQPQPERPVAREAPRGPSSPFARDPAPRAGGGDAPMMFGGGSPFMFQGSAPEPEKPKAEPPPSLDDVNILLLGDAQVGKAELVQQFTTSLSATSDGTAANPPEGVVFVEHRGRQVPIHIIETEDQARPADIPVEDWQRAHGLVLVYDVERQETFDSLAEWYRQIRRYARPKIRIVIDANAVSGAPPSVAAQRARTFAKEYGALFQETSTATGDHVNDVFFRLTTWVLVSRPAPGYQIHIHKCSASGIKPKRGSVYVEFLLDYSKGESAKSKELKKSSHPAWSDLLTLDGYAIGTDVLKVLVHEHSKHDSVIAVGKLEIRTVRPGPLASEQLALFKPTADNEPDRKNKAGVLSLELNLQRGEGQSGLWTEWFWPLCEATISVVNATGAPRTTLVAEVMIVPSPGQQPQTTSLGCWDKEVVTWQELLEVRIGDYENDWLQIRLIATNDEVARCLIPVAQFEAGTDWAEKTIKMEGNAITLKVRVRITCSNPDSLQHLRRPDAKSPRGKTPPAEPPPAPRADPPSPAPPGPLWMQPEAGVQDASSDVSPAIAPQKPRSTDISDWRKDFDSMKTVRSLGNGLFGDAWLVEDGDGELYTKKSVPLNPEVRGDMDLMFTREIETMIQFMHPCVVPFAGFSPATDECPPEIAESYFEGGSLRAAMDRRQIGLCPTCLSETGIAVIICGIVLGMRFVHSCGLVHGDLKPNNIILDEGGWPLIGDLAAGRLASLALSLPRDIGPAVYRAPKTGGSSQETMDGDVYSFALIAYELFTGEVLFPPEISREELRARDGPRAACTS